MSAQPPSILFLDDEKSYVELMTQLLSDNLGVPVFGYTEAAEALADLPSLGVAMIVTDYSMPRMSGLDFLQRAHGLCPQAAALMITGHHIEFDGRDLSHIPGLRETLFKPITWRTLAEQVVRHWPGANPPRIRDEPA